MIMVLKKYYSRNSQETRTLGLKLARTLVGGEVIALMGNLGSGKTTFAKGLAKGLGVNQTITSPTFVLMKIYKTKHKTIKQFVHVDCYRIPGIELANVGLTDYLNRPDTVVAIEWAEKLPNKFKPSIQIKFCSGKQADFRLIKIKSPRSR